MKKIGILLASIVLSGVCSPAMSRPNADLTPSQAQAKPGQEAALKAFDADVDRDVKSYTYDAIYNGIEGYGVSDSKDTMDSFGFIFTIYSPDHGTAAQKTFSIPNADGDFTLQNRLQEGYRFAISADADNPLLLTGINLCSPVGEGIVKEATAQQIILNGNQTYTLAPEVAYTGIEMLPGGSKTTLLDGIQAGESVKLYGNPVRFVDRTFVARPYSPPVTGTPGKRTLKNFLQTAFTPLGTTLYVYGGAWNWQDDGAGPNARRIGLPADWLAFFQMNGKTYEYKNPDPALSYYPWQGYNEYHYAGSDCSGFVGWTLYNTMHTHDGLPGFVMSSLIMAATLADQYGFGTLSKDPSPASFRPGDIVSIKGHVYIVVGRANDGSLLIIHSTVNDMEGSGIQLSGVGKNAGCDAVRLAQTYMKRYYPQWSERYSAGLKSQSSYLDFSPETAGHLIWHLNQHGLQDPDGYASMSAEEILADIFGER